MHRNVDALAKLIHKYLEKNSLNVENPLWEIKKSQLGGFGIFATRSIEVGEVIFRDHPVILGPRAALTCPLICVNCFKRDELRLCKNNCGLQVCSDQCQNSINHQKECKIIKQWQTKPISEELSIKLVKVLSPIRYLLLSDEDKEVVKYLKAHISSQHGFEVDIMKNVLQLNISEKEEMSMRFACAVMDSNSFEVIVGNEDNQSSVKGLYPLASLANHSCTPNTSHVFDKTRRMVVRAVNFIPKGAEILHSYSRFIWGTPTRRFHLLRTKHFLCKCQRCEDPTEFGSYMSAILCKICKNGRVIPIYPLTINSSWRCEACGEVIEKKDVAAVSSLLGSALLSFEDGDLHCMLKFVEEKLPLMVPENNETVVEMKYKIIWILGYRKGFTWTELSERQILIKEKYCRDLLKLIDTLKLGQCKMRGLLLYELYCCYKEMKSRDEKSGNVSKVIDANMKNLFREASDILMFDVEAPNEIKKLWPGENHKIILSTLVY